MRKVKGRAIESFISLCVVCTSFGGFGTLSEGLGMSGIWSPQEPPFMRQEILGL